VDEIEFSVERELHLPIGEWTVLDIRINGHRLQEMVKEVETRTSSGLDGTGVPGDYMGLDPRDAPTLLGHENRATRTNPPPNPKAAKPRRTRLPTSLDMIAIAAHAVAARKARSSAKRSARRNKTGRRGTWRSISSTHYFGSRITRLPANRRSWRMR
jgi:hypothetical protein